MNILLFRHGQVEGPAALYGKTDVALSDTGFATLQRAVTGLSGPDLIISSPLQRCHAFARLAATAHRCAFEIDPALREMDFGDWDGEPYRQDSSSWEQMEKFWANPADNPPTNGEALADMQARVSEAWTRLMARPEHSVWVFAHGGVIRLIIAEVLGLDWRNPALYSTLQIAYASKTEVITHHHEGLRTVQLKSIAVPAPMP